MAKKEKILIHSIVFSPDAVSTAYLYNDIASALKRNQYEVVVLTTTPHYNVLHENLVNQPLKKRLGGLYYSSEYNGIKVLHVSQKKFSSTPLRLLGFIYWHVMSFFIALTQGNLKLILSPSPPLTIGFVNLIIARLKGAKVIYNVQEIYPDFLIEQGGLKSSIAIRALKWLESFVYNKSDAVTTIDQIFYNTIENRFRDKSKLHIIPNFVDDELYKPINRELLELDIRTFVPSNNLKVMYAGNIGHAQDWKPLIEAANQLRDESIEFYIIGEGVMKSFLVEQVKELKLTKVHVLPYQPRQLMPQLISFSDLQFIFMSKEVEGHGFPSKVYTIMSCERPLLVCSGANTPIVNFLNGLDCAKLITARNENDKVNLIVKFLKEVSKERLQVMGTNGKIEIQEHYTKDKVTSEYVNLIDSLVK